MSPKRAAKRTPLRVHLCRSPGVFPRFFFSGGSYSAQPSPRTFKAQHFKVGAWNPRAMVCLELQTLFEVQSSQSLGTFLSRFDVKHRTLVKHVSGLGKSRAAEAPCGVAPVRSRKSSAKPEICKAQPREPGRLLDRDPTASFHAGHLDKTSTDAGALNFPRTIPGRDKPRFWDLGSSP